MSSAGSATTFAKVSRGHRDMEHHAGPGHDLTRMPEIDYDSHPAYGKCFGKAGRAIRARSHFAFWRSFAFVFVRWLIDYDNLPLLTRHREGRSVRSFARIAVPYLWMLARLKTQRAFQRLRAKPTVRSCDSSLAAELTRNGRITFGLDDKEKAAVVQATESAFQRLRDRRAVETSRKRDFEDSRLRTSRVTDPTLYKVLDELLERHGITAVAGAYLGREVGVKDVNPQINDPSDDFWRDQFADIGIPNSRTTYVHTDAGYGIMKLIIYISDVRPENGPFSYILGTNRMKVGFIEGMIRRANDYAGLSSTCRSARQLFYALPRALRKKCALGADILDDCPESNLILEKEWLMMPSEGDAILFDPFGLHRGGLVMAGERLVLTVVIGVIN